MRTSPYISANKLIEYVFATPTRRTSIIESVIAPPLFLLDTGYRSIEVATAALLASRGKDFSSLLDLDAALLKRIPATDHEEQRILTAHDAIELARTMDWHLPDGAVLSTLEIPPPKFVISGVEIRINPTVSLRVPQRGRREANIGFGKSYFSKCSPLHSGSNRDRGVLYASLLHWFTEVEFPELGLADHNLCFVGDVFTQRIFFAAKNFKQRRKLLAASAQEIADRWDIIRSRLDLDGVSRRARKRA